MLTHAAGSRFSRLHRFSHRNYPSRPVTIVAATTPGSLPDVLARGVGERLARKWGRSVVIENRAGGAYAVAASAVANTAPDGYTLLATESGFYTTQPHLSKGDLRTQRLTSFQSAEWYPFR